MPFDEAADKAMADLAKRARCVDCGGVCLSKCIACREFAHGDPECRERHRLTCEARSGVGGNDDAS